MANSLTGYIQKLKKEGYDEPTIRSHLFSEGYSPQQINEAMAARGLPGKRTLFFVGGAAGLLAVSFLLYFLLFPASKTIAFAMKPETVEISKGQQIVFDDVVTNIGKQSGFPVTIKHEVFGAQSLFVASSEETFTANEVQTKKIELSLPEDLKPGRYTVKASASFDSRQETAAFSFKVIEEKAVETPGVVAPPAQPEAAAGCPAGCDDMDSCTRDSCVGNKCVHDEIKPCCGNLVCEDIETTVSCPRDCIELPKAKTSAELADEAKSVAKSNPDRAVLLCSSIPQEGVGDGCFATVADEATNSAFCAKVKDSERRDNCFVSYVLKTNDFNVCSSIENVYMRKTCYNLRNLRAMQQAMASQGSTA